MKVQFSIIKLFVITLFLFLLVSCGAPPILIKPAANKVKKITLVSVTANRGVRNLKGQSKMEALTSVFSMVRSKTKGKDKEKKKDEIFDFGGNNLVNFAAETFNYEFAQIKGWQLVPSDDILGTDAYQKFRRNMKKFADSLLGEGGASKALSVLMDAGSISADGMPAAPYDGRAGDEKQMLTELAQDLGVDAVVVLEVDMAYAASTAIGGTGTAAGAVGIGMVVVNKFGDYVINTPNMRGQKDFTGYRVRSDNTVAMVAGNIIYSSKADAVFKDSISKGMDVIKTKINGELNPK